MPTGLPNPGNYVDSKGTTEWNDEVYRAMHEKVRERFGAFVERGQELKRAIRYWCQSRAHSQSAW